MAFQDFDQIKDRVSAQRKQKFRKKVIVASLLVLVIICLAVGAFFAYLAIRKNNAAKMDSDSKSPPSGSQTVNREQTEKIVRALCGSTLYVETCERSLKKAVQKDPSLSQPKNLLASAISYAGQEIDKAMNKAKALKVDDPDDRKAMELCKKLVSEAKEELNASISKVKATANAKNIAKISPDLNNWLSAVMSYQETCLDQFKGRKVKGEVVKALNSSMVSTSNSLAIVRSLNSQLSPGNWPGRSLLANKGRLPAWMSREDGRMLRALDVKNFRPNATVAKDGSGNFSTINEALKAMPENYKGRYVIYVKQGVYDETVVVDKKKLNLTLVGDGSQKSVITGNKSNKTNYRTFESATFVAQGEGFMARSMGFRNTAGPEGHQAVAARIQSDRSVFVNCRFEGYQETLYAHTHRQFYRSCVILGTVDFIFGDAAAIFQNCNIFIRKGLSGQQNTVTAQGRIDKFQTTGFVIQNCNIKAEEGLEPVKKEFKSYLGRPWKSYSRIVVMESTIEDVIDPAGWLKWQDSGFALKTLFYGEYGNDGASGKTNSRVNWPGFKVLKKEEALQYTVGHFVEGDWISATGTPVKFGLYAS